MTPTIRTLRVPAGDLLKLEGDPVATALVRDGWTVDAAIPVADGDDGSIVLILTAPRPEGRLRVALVAAGLLLLAGVALAAVIGPLVVR